MLIRKYEVVMEIPSSRTPSYVHRAYQVGEVVEEISPLSIFGDVAIPGRVLCKDGDRIVALPSKHLRLLDSFAYNPDPIGSEPDKLEFLEFCSRAKSDLTLEQFGKLWSKISRVLYAS